MENLNQALVNEAREEKLILGRKLKIDTTVMESNIHYPTYANSLSVVSGKLKGMNFGQ